MKLVPLLLRQTSKNDHSKSATRIQKPIKIVKITDLHIFRKKMCVKTMCVKMVFNCISKESAGYTDFDDITFVQLRLSRPASFDPNFPQRTKQTSTPTPCALQGLYINQPFHWSKNGFRIPNLSQPINRMIFSGITFNFGKVFEILEPITWYSRYPFRGKSVMKAISARYVFLLS